jgi:hypothetical protein
LEESTIAAEITPANLLWAAGVLLGREWEVKGFVLVV